MTTGIYYLGFDGLTSAVVCRRLRLASSPDSDDVALFSCTDMQHDVMIRSIFDGQRDGEKWGNFNCEVTTFPHDTQEDHGCIGIP